MKAMATDRSRRYPSVEAFAADIDAYQNGFATSAEDAGAWRRMKLWVGRNKVLAGAAAAMLVVVSGFTGKVVAEGRKATLALVRRETGSWKWPLLQLVWMSGLAWSMAFVVRTVLVQMGVT